MAPEDLSVVVTALEALARGTSGEEGAPRTRRTGPPSYPINAARPITARSAARRASASAMGRMSVTIGHTSPRATSARVSRTRSMSRSGCRGDRSPRGASAWHPRGRSAGAAQHHHPPLTARTARSLGCRARRDIVHGRPPRAAGQLLSARPHRAGGIHDLDSAGPWQASTSGDVTAITLAPAHFDNMIWWMPRPPPRRIPRPSRRP